MYLKSSKKIVSFFLMSVKSTLVWRKIENLVAKILKISAPNFIFRKMCVVQIGMGGGALYLHIPVMEIPRCYAR